MGSILGIDIERGFDGSRKDDWCEYMDIDYDLNNYINMKRYFKEI